jgi:carbon-monoxide dehydrogenase medium subunit
VKPAPFKYAVADTVEEACGLLEEFGLEASVLAGGQSLVPMLNMRLARPSVLVDIGRIKGLDVIDANGSLWLGAMVRQADAERSAVVRQGAPLLADALPFVAHAGIRTRGTIGGTTAHADPAAEVPAVLVALNAKVVVEGSKGRREIPAAEFFLSTFMTAIEPGEVVVGVSIPAPGERVGTAFVEMARRHGDFALVGAALQVGFDQEGLVTSARVVLTNVADVPFDATEVEEVLLGGRLDDATIADASEAAVRRAEPVSDLHATAQYRRSVAQALVRRGLERISKEQ